MKKRQGIIILSSLLLLLGVATSGAFINAPENKQIETALAASNPASGASYYATNQNDQYYQGIDDSLEGEQLIVALSTLTSSGFVSKSYSSLPDIYQYSDISNGKMVMIYTNSEKSFSPGSMPGSTNKEHIWPASWYGTDKREEGSGSPGADAHNIQPSASELNSKRGSCAFDELDFATSFKCYEFTKSDWSYGTPGDNDSYVWSTAHNYSNGQAGDALYPARGSRGRTARALLYVATRYRNDTRYPVMLHDRAETLRSGRIGKLSTLLKWHFEEPPTEWEMKRNNEVATRWHHNRNPFVDHPEYAAKIYYTLPEPGSSDPTAAVKNAIETYSTTPDSIKLDKSSLEVAVNETIKINVSSNPNNETITWHSSNNQVATVNNNGLITGVSKGTATITAEGNETSAMCFVKVYDPNEVINVSNISLDITSKSLKVGSDFKITATVTPTDATKKTLDWSSSNTGIAVVDGNGRVTGVSTGSATITAKATDGSNKSATCSVTVTQAGSGSGDWTLVTNSSSLETGDHILITAKAENYVMSTTQNDNNRASVSVVKSDNLILNIDESTMQVITLEPGTVSNTFALNVGDEYLYAGSSSSNQLKVQTSIDANASFAITVTSEGAATVKAQGSNTRNVIRFNTGNNPKLFSCYGSGQADISIYKLDELNTTYKTDAYDYASTFMTTTSIECGDLSVKQSTWNTLKSSFIALSDDARNYIFDNFETDILIEAMIERYSFIINKYGYENFIKNAEGEPLIVSGNNVIGFMQFDSDYTIFVVLLAVVILLPTGVIIGLRMHYNKKSNKDQ